MLRTVHHFLIGSIGFAVVLLSATLCFGSKEYVFDTTNGTMTFDTVPVTEVHGTPFVSSVVNGTQQFSFLGDLTFVDNDRISAVGSRPLSLFAGNDVNISSLASFNFDAVGQFGDLGGGTGGTGSFTGDGAGAAGVGGDGGVGGTGGAGGLAIVNPFGCDCRNGDPGQVGQSGFGGTHGGNGLTGGTANSGTFGFNNASGGGNGGGGGTGGSRGFGADGSLRGGAGTFGLGGHLTAGGGNGGNGGNALDAADATHGAGGGTGTNGSGGSNAITGLMLSGGAGDLGRPLLLQRGFRCPRGRHRGDL